MVCRNRLQPVGIAHASGLQQLDTGRAMNVELLLLRWERRLGLRHQRVLQRRDGHVHGQRGTPHQSHVRGRPLQDVASGHAAHGTDQQGMGGAVELRLRRTQVHQRQQDGVCALAQQVTQTGIEPVQSLQEISSSGSQQRAIGLALQQGPVRFFVAQVLAHWLDIGVVNLRLRNLPQRCVLHHHLVQMSSKGTQVFGGFAGVDVKPAMATHGFKLRSRANDESTLRQQHTIG